MGTHNLTANRGVAKGLAKAGQHFRQHFRRSGGQVVGNVVRWFAAQHFHNLSTTFPSGSSKRAKRMDLRFTTCPSTIPPEMLPIAQYVAVGRKCVNVSNPHTSKGNVVLKMLTASKPVSPARGGEPLTGGYQVE